MSFFETEENSARYNQQLTDIENYQSVVKNTQKTVPSGIPGFDTVLGQGLIEGNVYLIVSDSGEHSKQIIHQMLYNRITSKSHVRYYTLEDSSVDIVDEMAHNNMNIEEFVNEGSWKFVRMTTAGLKQIVDSLPNHPLDEIISIDEDIGSLTNHVLKEMKNYCNSVIQITHLIRDLTPLQIQQMVLYLKGAARKFDGVHFIVLNQGGDNKDKEFILRDLADIVIEVNTALKMNDIEISTVIKKARKMKGTARKLNLLDKNGILSGSTIQKI